MTPWLVATWHPPWYSTYKAHYREAECMKVAMEELLYKYAVDLVFNGHVSAYFHWVLFVYNGVCYGLCDSNMINVSKRSWRDTPTPIYKILVRKSFEAWLTSYSNDNKQCSFNLLLARNFEVYKTIFSWLSHLGCPTSTYWNKPIAQL